MAWIPTFNLPKGISCVMQLSDTVAIVTGAAGGVGRGIALALAQEGADVAICDVREFPDQEADVRSTADLVRETGQKGLFRRADVTDEAAVEAFVAETVEEFGGLDVVVNNAGILPKEAREQTADELDTSLWTNIIDVNLTGMFHCVKHGIPCLRESDRPRIINIASQLGLVGHPTAPAYCASKGGVINFTRQLAVDYGPENIPVNAICPGFIDTETKKYRLEDDETREMYESNTLLPFFGEPLDIGRGAVFLASDDARFMTGQCLVIDGGWTAR